MKIPDRVTYKWKIDFLDIFSSYEVMYGILTRNAFEFFIIFMNEFVYSHGIISIVGWREVGYRSSRDSESS